MEKNSVADGMRLFWSLCVPCRLKVQALKKAGGSIPSEALCVRCRKRCEDYMLSLKK